MSSADAAAGAKAEWGAAPEGSPEVQAQLAAAGALHVLPLDKANAELLAKVHPRTHANPDPAPVYNMVVVGAGAGGLVTAAQCAKRGARVAIVEANLLGGDCLNSGCVPSKALLSCAKHIKYAREKVRSTFGIRIKGGDAVVEVDFPAIMARMRRIRAEIAANDSVRRFRDDLGVDVFVGRATFTSPHEVQVKASPDAAPVTLRFRKACIATGGRPMVPPISGIQDVPFRTNETIFNLTELPPRVAVIGTGPIGCELAQAFCFFGSEVTVFGRSAQPLRKEDPDAAEVLLTQMRKDGVNFVTGVRYDSVSSDADGVVTVTYTTTADGVQASVQCDVLLVATGRTPNVTGQGLERAEVEFDTRTGVKVDDFLCTTNPDVYAVGDVCLRAQFTHTAGETGLMVTRNALGVGDPQRYSDRVIPWCTYTFPEIAHVGGYARDLDAADLRTFTLPLRHFDRCVTDDFEGEAGGRLGFVRIHTRKESDTILGATIVAQNAGELISFFTLAMHAGVGAKVASDVIAPYPTVSEVSKYTCNQVNISDWGGWDGLKATWAGHMQAQLGAARVGAGGEKAAEGGEP